MTEGRKDSLVLCLQYLIRTGTAPVVLDLLVVPVLEMVLVLLMYAPVLCRWNYLLWVIL